MGSVTGLLVDLVLPVLFAGSRLHTVYIGALMSFCLGMTMLVYETCAYCNRVINQVEAGFMRDFTRDELLFYISALQYTHLQMYFGSAVILIGLFLLAVTKLIGQFHTVATEKQHNDITL
jgi:hypothetical protein